MTTTMVLFTDTAAGWERALYAFLAEKERRTGSRRTVDAYSRMLQQFFGPLGKTPDQVTSQDVFAYAHGICLSGKVPSATTIGARIACLSSFYRFLVRMKIVQSNPCDQLERPRVSQSPPRGLSAQETRCLLAVLPDTAVGLRDRAIILTFVLTGRRRSEVLRLKASDISTSSGVFYAYRGKGGKTGRRELPRPVFEAIQKALGAFGKDLSTMGLEESLWPSRNDTEPGLSSSAFYSNLLRYLRKASLPPAGVHILRHTAAKLRRDVGESVEQVSRFLDHSSLAMTTVYLRRLEGQGDRTWGKVAEAIGL